MNVADLSSQIVGADMLGCVCGREGVFVGCVVYVVCFFFVFFFALFVLFTNSSRGCEIYI